MNFGLRFGLTSAFCLLLAFAACREDRRKALPPPPSGVARVGNASISREAFQQLMQSRLGVNSNLFAGMAAKKTLLEEMIDREAVYAKAKAAGFDQRPEVQQSIKRMIAAKYEDEMKRQPGTNEPLVSAMEIEQFYQQHPDKYAAGARSRGAMILARIPARAEPEKRAEAMNRAQKIMEEAQAAATPAEFAVVVQKHSEDQATRYRGGDMGWVSQGTPPLGMEAAVAEALFALKKPGDFAPLVATEKGVYIVKLTDKQPAGVRPLAEVKQAIADQLTRQKQAQRDKDFYAAMREGLDIQINLSLLESIRPEATPVKHPPGLPGVVAQTFK